jgi:hypothetical protein
MASLSLSKVIVKLSLAIIYSCLVISYFNWLIFIDKLYSSSFKTFSFLKCSSILASIFRSCAMFKDFDLY